MRLVKTLESILVAALAISAMAATGVEAHEFEASSSPLLLLAKQEALQVFTTLAGTLTCATLKGHGITAAKLTKTQKVTISYSGCKALVGGINGTVTEPVNAEYEYSAEGTMRIVKGILITATLAGVKCEIGISPQTPPGTVAYTNIAGGKVLLAPNLTGIETSAKGAGCQEQYTSTKNCATYVDKSIIEADGGGTIAWK